ADGTATFSTSSLSVGSHVIHAAFTGTNGWLNSSGDSASQVVQDGTSTAIASSPNPSSFGASVSFTATVTAAGAGTPSGTITFAGGGNTLATVAVDATGTASFGTSSLGVGSHTITATFSGTTGWLTSTNSTSQQVNDGTNTALTSSPNPAPFGGAITFNAAV